jgi:pimeloyl-ACP methyl ester carboxylesterase
MSSGSRVPLVINDIGTGRPVLVLHGGGGPDTIKPIAAHLAAGYRVLTPTLPGWNGAPRPASMTTIGDYAQAYLDHLAQLGVGDVVAIGSSLGGWIAAEMAVRDRAGMLGAIVIVDGAGISVEGEPLTDFFSLTPREVAEHSWHDPDRYYVDPSTFPPERAAMQQANIRTMALVAREMNDPWLRGRLGDVTIPVLVIWGDSDRIFTPGYGRAYAASFPDGRFALIADAGHLPQLEQPTDTFDVIDDFVRTR